MELEEPEQKLEQGDVRKQIEETLTEFTRTQSDIIEQSNNLSSKPVADLTAEEKDAFRAAAIAEDDLSKFLEELISDLSKLPEQDFSAPSLKTNLSKSSRRSSWLKTLLICGTRPSRLAKRKRGSNSLNSWSMTCRDGSRTFRHAQVGDGRALERIRRAMAELPDELYDMMGDLIDQESAMTEEVEDESSSWADSIDAGAGGWPWTAHEQHERQGYHGQPAA